MGEAIEYSKVGVVGFPYPLTRPLSLHLIKERKFDTPFSRCGRPLDNRVNFDAVDAISSSLPLCKRCFYEGFALFGNHVVSLYRAKQEVLDV